MRFRHFATSPLVLCVLSTVCSAQPATVQNALTDEERIAGWELLFDGTTTKGWRSPTSDRFPQESWVIEDGFLRAIGAGNRASDLRTAGVYRNFELTFEWKISPGGNSGVKYRVGSAAKLVFDNGKLAGIEGQVKAGPNAFFAEVTSGFEYQLIDNEQNPDKDNPKTRTGALYEIVAPAEGVLNPAGQLNQSRIVVNGTKIEHWLNGVRVMETDVSSTDFLEAVAKAPERSQRVLNYLKQDCPIALQGHGSPVWFRNLKLRRLPDTR